MGMMMYMIVMDYQMSVSHQHNVTAEERNHYHSTMVLEWQVVPGLSIMNLLSFIFCIPVQVNLNNSIACIYKCDLNSRHRFKKCKQLFNPKSELLIF